MDPVTSRVPAGVPTGGQFAASSRTESQVTLDGTNPGAAPLDPIVYAVEPGYTRQTTEPMQRLHLEESSRSARELARMAEDGQIDVNPPYQRGSVWSTDQRIALVKSWLQGVPVPAVILNDRTTTAWKNANGSSPLDGDGTGLWAVVDGKQRLETARMWFGGDLAVPASWFENEDIDTTEDTADGPYVRYTGLTKRGQTIMAMSGARLGANTAQVPTVEAEADLYLLVNGGGTPQTAADMANAAAHSSSGSSTSPEGN
ncbi:hypothetical protein GCM10027273_10310 [Nocardioides pakistanensis]